MSIIIDLFNTFPLFYLFTIFILGLLIGSFLNVVILRLPIMMERDWKQQCCELLNIAEDKENIETSTYGLITPRSHCPICNHQISAIENIPILNFIFVGVCLHIKFFCEIQS